MTYLYTEPLQITQPGEPKPWPSDPTKFRYSFKDSNNQWYTTFELEVFNQAKQLYASGQKAIIQYQPGKPNKKGGMFNPTCDRLLAEDADVPTTLVQAQSLTPPQTYENASDSTMSTDEAIARAVALKAAVELMCTDQLRPQSDHLSHDLYKLADVCLAWLKNEHVKPLSQEDLQKGIDYIKSEKEKVSSQEERVPTDDINVEDIPF